MKNYLLLLVAFGLITVGLTKNLETAGTLGARKATPENAALMTAKAAATPSGTYSLWVTAYASTPEETDDTPFITASGEYVHDGIVATNVLPFGTKVQIPSLFGDKTFTVEDRMHERKKDFIDIWMSTKDKAILFGIHRATVVVVEEPSMAFKIPSRTGPGR